MDRSRNTTYRPNYVGEASVIILLIKRLEAVETTNKVLPGGSCSEKATRGVIGEAEILKKLVTYIQNGPVPSKLLLETVTHTRATRQSLAEVISVSTFEKNSLFI